MKKFKRWWKALWARYERPPVIYKETPFYTCKFCKRVYMNGIFKDICATCTKKGIEYAILKSNEETK